MDNTRKYGTPRRAQSTLAFRPHCNLFCGSLRLTSLLNHRGWRDTSAVGWQQRRAGGGGVPRRAAATWPLAALIESTSREGGSDARASTVALSESHESWDMDGGRGGVVLAPSRFFCVPSAGPTVGSSGQQRYADDAHKSLRDSCLSCERSDLSFSHINHAEIGRSLAHEEGLCASGLGRNVMERRQRSRRCRRRARRSWMEACGIAAASAPRTRNSLRWCRSLPDGARIVAKVESKHRGKENVTPQPVWLWPRWCQRRTPVAPTLRKTQVWDLCHQVLARHMQQFVLRTHNTSLLHMKCSRSSVLFSHRARFVGG